MGYLGQDIKKLGFGLMRLPQKDGVIDVEQVKVMVDKFLDAGYTYFDTAWAYGGSEDAIRQALVERYPREKYQLATKNACWIKCETREEAIGQFETSLQRTGAGYFDFYLLHNLGENRTAAFDKFGMWDWAQEQKAKGLIKHVGFSFHSTPEELEAILNAHPEMEFVQLQINYADWDNPRIQSRANYEVARVHGKPVIVMEPVKGGMLADPAPEVQEVLKAAEPDVSPASWAVRYAASLEGIITVLSGMSSVAQMEDNLATMQGFTALTEDQQAVIRKATEVLNTLPVIPCTSCDYCAKVCPMEIGISGTLAALNQYTKFGKGAMLQQMGWRVDGKGKKRPDQCVKCGKCEEACPQHIGIREHLAKAAEILG